MDGNEMIRLAKAVARRHYGERGDKDEDLISEGIMGIMRAEARYEDGRGSKLITYAYASARNAMRRYMAKEARWRNYVMLNGNEAEEAIAEEIDKAGEIERIIERLGIKEGSLGFEIMSGERQTDIARRRGISRQRVSKEFKKIKNRVLSIYEYKDGGISEK